MNVGRSILAVGLLAPAATVLAEVVLRRLGDSLLRARRIRRRSASAAAVRREVVASLRTLGIFFLAGGLIVLGGEHGVFTLHPHVAAGAGGYLVASVVAMIVAYDAYFYWLHRLHTQAESEGRLEKSDQERQGYWQSPRIGVAETLDQSAAMMDRFNRIMLRTLRSLRDLRRYTPPVIVRHAEQVNVGEQQINLSRK